MEFGMILVSRKGFGLYLKLLRKPLIQGTIQRRTKFGLLCIVLSSIFH